MESPSIFFWIATRLSASRNDEQIDNSIPLYRHCERSEAIHKENPLAKNAKSVESLKVFSDFIESSDKINLIMDCHENPCGFSRNDEQKSGLPRLGFAKSRNDSIETFYFHRLPRHAYKANPQ